MLKIEVGQTWEDKDKRHSPRRRIKVVEVLSGWVRTRRIGGEFPLVLQKTTLFVERYKRLLYEGVAPPR